MKKTEEPKNIDEITQLRQMVESLIEVHASSVNRIEKLETKVISLQQRTSSNYDWD